MTTVDLPAHPALRPKPLEYGPASGAVAYQLAGLFDAASVHRARTAHAMPFGYYRVAAEPVLFVKVFPRDRLRHLLAVQDLTATLHRAGCPVQTVVGPPLDLPGEAVGLVHGYIVERFAGDIPADASQVGAALRSIHNALAPLTPPAGAVRISAQWHAAIRRLSQAPTLDALAAAQVTALLSRWDDIAPSLDRASQLIHNDYHRGNVLMGVNGVAAILDFDDAIAATGSTLIDLAIGLERFCLAGNTPALGASLVAAFMAGYGRGMSELSADEIRQIATARLLFSLAILHDNPRPDDPGWLAEYEKFKGLLQHWPTWRRLLIAGGARP